MQEARSHTTLPHNTSGEFFKLYKNVMQQTIHSKQLLLFRPVTHIR